MPVDPLLKRQLDAGAVPAVESAPRPAVAHFGDPAGEYRSATESAAVCDVSDRTRIRLAGPEPAKFLHAYCTNDVTALAPGEGCEAFVTSLKGRILGHVWAAVGEADVTIDTWPGQYDMLSGHLARYAMLEGIEIEDRTEEIATLCVCGPRVAEMIGVEELEPFRHRTIEDLGPSSVDVQRVDWFRVPTFPLSVRRADAVTVWEMLVDRGLAPVGREVCEVLRIEAGLPRYGIDVTDANIAQEAARTERAISFTKGCYLGQEPIHRLHAMGHTNREFRILRCESQELSAGDVLTDGNRDLGTVTSAAVHPVDRTGIGLGVIRLQPEDATVVTDGHPVVVSVP